MDNFDYKLTRKSHNHICIEILVLVALLQILKIPFLHNRKNTTASALSIFLSKIKMQFQFLFKRIYDNKQG